MLRQTTYSDKSENTKCGQLHLVFEPIRGRTRLIDCYQTPPLKASRTLYLDGNQKTTVYLMESSGGMVAGDRNEYKIHIKKGGNVCLKPQSATKIYPSLHSKACYQTVSIMIDDKAELEWNRDELIPFEKAIFHGRNTIQMSSTSTLLWGEIIYPGREKRGEQYQYHEFKNRLEIWLDGSCIVYDTMNILPKTQSLQGKGVLEHFHYIGTIWFVSPKATNVDEVLLSQRHTQTNEHIAGVSRLHKNGITIRWLSNNLPLLKKEMENAFNMFNAL